MAIPHYTRKVIREIFPNDGATALPKEDWLMNFECHSFVDHWVHIKLFGQSWKSFQYENEQELRRELISIKNMLAVKTTMLAAKLAWPRATE